MYISNMKLTRGEPQKSSYFPSRTEIISGSTIGIPKTKENTLTEILYASYDKY